MIAVDTSFLVALDDRNKKAIALEKALRNEGHEFLVPAPAWVEYLTGFTPRSAQAKAQFLDKEAHFVPFERATATEALRLQRTLLDSGMRLGWSDLYIAATALQHSVPLASMDDDFDIVPDLQVIRA